MEIRADIIDFYGNSCGYRGFLSNFNGCRRFSKKFLRISRISLEILAVVKDLIEFLADTENFMRISKTYIQINADVEDFHWNCCGCRGIDKKNLADTKNLNRNCYGKRNSCGFRRFI